MGSVLLTLVFFLLINANINGQQLYPTSTGSVGAVYTMSNGPNMNQVIIHTLTANGQLSMIGAVNTNGTGVNITTADPLFSQGAMVVYSSCLFVVNPGSNSLSMFMINPSDGTQLTLVSVQSSNGWYPVSVTANKMYACVLTGGNITGIRCFTYNSSGLFIVPSFDRNLTSYISQSVPPMGPLKTMSEILFSADNLALIVSIKGYNSTSPGCLLFYSLSNNSMTLAPSPIQRTPTNAVLPFSMTLVGMNGLLITDPGAQGVLTLSYSSTSGMINNSMLTPINASLAGALCWSTYSPATGNYYVIGASPAAIVELNLNFGPTTSPVKIVQYYQLPNNTGALDATVVSLAGNDYLYVIGTTAHVISGYQLRTAGNATAIGIAIVQQGDTTKIPKLAGIAAFVQTRSSLGSSPASLLTSSLRSTPVSLLTSSLGSSAVSLLTSTITIMICMVFIFSGYE